MDTSNFAFQPSILFGLLTIVLCGLVVFALARLTGPAHDVSENRQQSLDGLRGFLATGVFLHHFALTFYLHATGKWAVPDSRFYSLLGSISVSLFFMITGFLFWQKLVLKNGRVNWGSLYISRIFRILPLYWFAVAVVVLIVLWAGGPQLNVPLRNFLKQIGYWVSFANYPDINKYHSTYSIVAGVLWTLKYEWLFYLSLPVLAIFIVLNEKIPGTLWVLAAVVLWLSYRPIYIDTLLISSVYLVYFLAGAVAASLARNERARFAASHPAVTVVALISLMLAFALFEGEYVFNRAILLAAFFIPVALGNSIFGILSLEPFRVLGDISYSVYILHGIVLYVLYTLLFPATINPQSNAYLFYGLMAVTGIVVVVISWITYSLVERPFIALGRKLASFSFKKQQPVKEGLYERN
jgi:peptidoglycan/LPS O-acetylase OafA/YrhL